MVNKYTCKNGVRIVMEKIPTVRSVSLGIWIKTGSRNEPKELNGISHFLEHMFFKGTKTRSARDIAESFDRIGGQVNAFTSKEYTCYYAKVLDRHTSYALNILADMFFNSTFDEEELSKEKKVVMEEIKMYEDTPDDIVHDLLSKAVYENHSLGYPILGTEETVASFNRQTLKTYMEQMYTPENVVISIAGNVDETLIQEVENLFGSYQVNNRRIEKELPKFHQNQIVKRKDTEQAHLCIGFEGIPVSHHQMYPLIIANNILGGGMSSRLFQEIREEKGLAYSIFSYHSSFYDTGMVTIYGGTGVDQMDTLFESIQTSIHRFVEKGITDREIKNSKEQLKGNIMLSLESTNSRMSRNGKNELYLKKHRTLDETIQLIDGVTKEEVNSLIQKIFSNHFSIAVINPTGRLPKE
ncbi:M16 family metallopeptidase [Fervidibacillus halotolerans]|uniref:Insulinase family protein n=1 Tax=Fervidibacillus halotolerans TaxID=2980027 RepID=A0A9E8M2U2_9BACI|nr:pitrilysin family protein [Fervidibacillus halotolerans]WAA13556.1 insulinase family protein [Fervidibacillus halotolerans]